MKTKSRSFAPATPVALGDCLSADKIIDRYFSHVSPRPTERWVQLQMPIEKRVRIGRKFCWWTADIEAHLAGMRGAA